MGFFFIQIVFIFVPMAAKESTIRLHQDIKREFEKLSAVREFGVKKYSYEYMLAKIAHNFYKSPKTIENIVFNRVNIDYNLPKTLFNS